MAALESAEATAAAREAALIQAWGSRGRGASTEQVVDQRRVAYQQAEQDAARARAALRRYDVPDPESQADVQAAQRARADLDKGARAGAVCRHRPHHLCPARRAAGEAGLLTFASTT